MVFFHGTSAENWELIQKEGQLFGVVGDDHRRMTYLATEYDEACCYGEIVLAVEYDPYKKGATNNYIDGCWQLRVYDPIPIENINIVRTERYVLITDKTEDEIKNANFLKVFRTIKSDKKWHIIFPSPIVECSIAHIKKIYDILDKGGKAYLLGGSPRGVNNDGTISLKLDEIYADITKDFALTPEQKEYDKYNTLIRQYNEQHRVCPKCGSRNYTVSLVGFPFDTEHPEEYKDRNSVKCQDCGWHGIVHDLVAEKK